MHNSQKIRLGMLRIKKLQRTTDPVELISLLNEYANRTRKD